MIANWYAELNFFCLATFTPVSALPPPAWGFRNKAQQRIKFLGCIRVCLPANKHCRCCWIADTSIYCTCDNFVCHLFHFAVCNALQQLLFWKESKEELFLAISPLFFVFFLFSLTGTCAICITLKTLNPPPLFHKKVHRHAILLIRRNESICPKNILSCFFGEKWRFFFVWFCERCDKPQTWNMPRLHSWKVTVVNTHVSPGR